MVSSGTTEIVQWRGLVCAGESHGIHIFLLWFWRRHLFMLDWSSLLSDDSLSGWDNGSLWFTLNLWVWNSSFYCSGFGGQDCDSSDSPRSFWVWGVQRFGGIAVVPDLSLAFPRLSSVKSGNPKRPVVIPHALDDGFVCYGGGSASNGRRLLPLTS